MAVRNTGELGRIEVDGQPQLSAILTRIAKRVEEVASRNTKIEGAAPIYVDHSGEATIISYGNRENPPKVKRCPLELIFTKVGEAQVLSFAQTYVTVPTGKYGTYAALVPTLNDTPIIDDGSSSWAAPTFSLSDETYKVWLVVASTTAKIRVLTSAETPPESKDENTVDLIAEFTVSGGLVTESKKYNCPRLCIDLPHRHEGYPYLWNNGTAEEPEWKIRFTQAIVTDVETGNITVVSNPTEEFDVEADDEFHLKHSVSEGGNTTSLEFVKETAPTTDPFILGIKSGEYYRKIVVVKEDEDGGLFPEIFRSFGIDWQGGDNNSSSSGGSSSSDYVPSSGGGDSSSEGSSKDTAIVPAPWLYSIGYTHTAYFAEECPEVIFSDWFTADLEKTVTHIAIDPRFLYGTVDDTIRVVGMTASKAWPVGVRVDGEQLVITRWPFCKLTVSGRLSGVRMGFEGVRYPHKTQADFDANEAWLKRGEVKS